MRREQIDYVEFKRLLAAEFPEVEAAFDDERKGLLHCEMGTFALLAEQAMDDGFFWRAQRYFEFIAKVRRYATHDVENAIDVSFIEYLAFSEFSDKRYEGLKRMPNELRRILFEIDERDRWR